MNIENKFLLVCVQLIILLMPLTVGEVQDMNRGRVPSGDLLLPPLFSSVTSSAGSLERTCRLFNRKARAHLVINKDRVSANASDLDEKGEIGLESVMKDGVVRTRIRGIYTENYLCFNHKGRVVSKPKERARGAKCEFVENVNGDGSQFISALNPAWALGFSHKGMPMLGAAYESGRTRCPLCFSFYKTASTKNSNGNFNPARHNKGIGQAHPGLQSDFLNSFQLAMPKRKNGSVATTGRNGTQSSADSSQPKPHRLRHRKKHLRRHRNKLM